MDSFVLGFVFDKSGEDVLLIRKARPAWQEGFLNGIGGHIETGESPAEAMSRECKEETGLVLKSWEHVIIFTCQGGTVFVFRAYDNQILEVDGKEANGETLCVTPAGEPPEDTIDNLHWMIPMIQDKLQFPILITYDFMRPER